MMRTGGTCSTGMWTGRGARERRRNVSFGCGGTTGFLDEEEDADPRIGAGKGARGRGGRDRLRRSVAKKSRMMLGVSAAAARNRYAVHRPTASRRSEEHTSELQS